MTALGTPGQVIEACRAAGIDAEAAAGHCTDSSVAARSEDASPGLWVNPPLVDLSVLKALIGDDEAAVADVLEAFCDSATSCLSVLLLATAHGDLCAVADVAHKLKSGALSIGAQRLGQRCMALEMAADAGGQVGVATQVPLFEAELRDVLDFLRCR